MDTKIIKNLIEAYQTVYAPQEVDEATAMAKRGLDEPAIRQKIAKSTGGGEAADRATKLADKPSYGQGNSQARQKLAAKQRGDFRNTTSSNPGLHVGQHKATNAADKAKQAARGAQRGVLTPNERKQLNMGDESFDVFDLVLEFLCVEGYAETLEEAEWMMANVIDEEAIGIILGEAITSEKGKAKAAEMIAKRSTPSGRAKSGQGASVAAIKHISRANVDGYGGTPPNLKVAKNPVKSNFTGLNTGTGNKAARRAAALKKEEFEFWVDALVEEGYDLSGYTWDEMYEFYLDEASRRDEFTRASIARYAGKKGISFEPGPNWDPSANRGRGAHLNPKQKEKQRRKALRQEEYVDEAQHARENPEKYEADQKKKYAPVRGERTPMPPRGDKRREDFEKWYAKNVR